MNSVASSVILSNLSLRASIRDQHTSSNVEDHSVPIYYNLAKEWYEL